MLTPIVARGDVSNVTSGGCAFGMTGSTGGVRVTRTIRALFGMGITGIGAVDIHNGRGHVNHFDNCATS